MAAAIQQTSFNFITTGQKSETNVTVTLEAKGLVPGRSSKDAKNGEVSVNFFNQGFDASFMDKETNKLWKYKAIRLPTAIEPKQCTWMVEKGQIVVTLIKKQEKSKDGTEHYVDWKPMLHANGLDQYDSSEDEDGNVPNLGAFRLKSLDLPFEVEHGKDNVFEVTSDFMMSKEDDHGDSDNNADSDSDNNADKITFLSHFLQ